MPSRKSTCTDLRCFNRVQSDFITKYATRVVNTSQKYAGVSSNWKMDYYMFKILSFAQVLKRAISNQKIHGCSKVNGHNTQVASVVKKTPTHNAKKWLCPGRCVPFDSMF